MRVAAFLTAVGALLLGASWAFADLRPPPPRTKPAGTTPATKPPATKALEQAASAPFVIVVDDSVQEPTLQIPRKLMTSAEATAETQATETAQAGLPLRHTLIAGLALAAALAFGGLWFAKAGGKIGGKNIAWLLTAFGVLSVAGLVWANVPPPRDPPVTKAPPPATKPEPTKPKSVLPSIPLADQANIEIVENGDAIKLIVNREHFRKLQIPALDSTPARPPEE